MADSKTLPGFGVSPRPVDDGEAVMIVRADEIEVTDLAPTTPRSVAPPAKETIKMAEAKKSSMPMRGVPRAEAAPANIEAPTAKKPVTIPPPLPPPPAEASREETLEIEPDPASPRSFKPENKQAHSDEPRAATILKTDVETVQPETQQALTPPFPAANAAAPDEKGIQLWIESGALGNIVLPYLALPANAALVLTTANNIERQFAEGKLVHPDAKRWYEETTGKLLISKSKAVPPSPFVRLGTTQLPAPKSAPESVAEDAPETVRPTPTHDDAKNFLANMEAAAPAATKPTTSKADETKKKETDQPKAPPVEEKKPNKVTKYLGAGAVAVSLIGGLCIAMLKSKAPQPTASSATAAIAPAPTTNASVTTQPVVGLPELTACVIISTMDSSEFKARTGQESPATYDKKNASDALAKHYRLDCTNGRLHATDKENIIDISACGMCPPRKK